MNYRKRSNHYLFTISKCRDSEEFFKALRKVNRTLGKGQLYRLGRLRNRAGLPPHQKVRGHVPIKVCDRFDVYVRIPVDYSNHSWTFHSADLKHRTRDLIDVATKTIGDNWTIIEYCNEVHKDLFDKIFYPKNKPEIVSIPATDKDKFIADRYKVTEIMKPIYTPHYTNWEVKLSANVRCVGKGAVGDVEHFFKNVTGLSDVVLSDATPIDEHKDLPLVSFRYPPADKIGYSDVYADDRSIRVTKMDDTYLEGFDGQQFKKFRVDRIVGEVKLVELAGKQD